MQRMIYWRAATPSVQKIGSAESTLKDIKVGETILLRSESGQVERKVASVRIDEPYIEITFEPLDED